MLTGAEPFDWKGTNDWGVLLVHGFTGSPSELRELGERLHEKGCTVMGILLKGHGTRPSDLIGVTAEDWVKQVLEGIRLLRKECPKVAVIGLSMGGLLALAGTASEPVDRLILISTPIFLYDWRVHFLWLAGQVISSLPKRRRHIDAPARYDVAYHEMPLAGVQELKRLLAWVKWQGLKQVTSPCLIIQSRADRTVRPESADYLYEHITSSVKRIYFLEEGKHVVTLYKEREEVYREIFKFLEESHE